jgi:hypothetical protein
VSIFILGSACPALENSKALHPDSLRFHLQALLTRYGFENVLSTVSENADEIRISYENRVLRNDLTAVGVVLHLLSGQLRDSTTIILIPLNRGIPIASLRLNISDYRRFIEGSISEPDFIDLLQINKVVPLPHNNNAANSPSFRKLDFTVVPSHTIQLGNYEDNFKFSGYLIPEVSSFLWPGAALRAQVIVPVYDEIGQYTKEVHLSRLVFNQVLRLPTGSLVGINLGVFEPSRYGVSAQVGHFLLNQHFWIGAVLDYTGFLQYQHQEWTYSKPGITTDRVFLDYFFNKLDFVLRLQYADYLWGDHGWSFHVSRLMGDVKFAFYVAMTDQDKFGGFELILPLSPQRLPAAKRVRLNWPAHYTWSYRATSETITLDAPLMTGQSVSTGYELDDFHKKLTTSYIRNNIRLWKQSQKFIRSYH